MIRNDMGIGKLFNYAGPAGKASQIKGVMAQAPDNIKAVEEIIRENTVTYNIPVFDKYDTEKLEIRYNSSKDTKTFIKLYIHSGNTHYNYFLQEEGNSIKLSGFSKDESWYAPDSSGGGGFHTSNKLTEGESAEINKALDLMIKKTPHHKIILNYIKSKNKQGEISLDK